MSRAVCRSLVCMVHGRVGVFVGVVHVSSACNCTVLCWESRNSSTSCL